MRTAAVLLLALLPLVLRGENRAAQEDTIREAVFRYMLPKTAPAPNERYKVYFLEILNAAKKERDPSDQMMKNLAGSPVRVLKSSKSRTVLGGEGIVMDPETKEFGTVLIVSDIKWKSATEVIVSGGYYYSMAGAEDFDYTVRKTGNHWIVVKRVLIGEA
jgi:hypothetical protein